MAATSRDVLLDGLFEAIDAMDADRFVGFLTPDATFRFGSAPAVAGRDAIREAVAGFFASIAGLSHTVTKVLRDGSCLVCIGEVTYVRHDGRRVPLPFADSFDMQGDAIRDYRIYMDISPLYAD